MASRMTAEQVAGAQIKALRTKRGWSLADLAARTGLTRQAIHRLEHGAMGSPLSRYEEIAKALDVPLSALLSDADAKQSKTKH